MTKEEKNILYKIKKNNYLNSDIIVSTNLALEYGKKYKKTLNELKKNKLINSDIQSLEDKIKALEDHKAWYLSTVNIAVKMKKDLEEILDLTNNTEPAKIVEAVKNINLSNNMKDCPIEDYEIIAKSKVMVGLCETLDLTGDNVTFRDVLLEVRKLVEEKNNVKKTIE